VLQLYTYYRSQASFRVRIALNLKGLKREDVFLHLEHGDQFAPQYRAVNPQMVVPTLIDGPAKLFQSLAILEYLEEKYPEPPLLPTWWQYHRIQLLRRAADGEMASTAQGGCAGGHEGRRHFQPGHCFRPIGEPRDRGRGPVLGDDGDACAGAQRR